MICLSETRTIVAADIAKYSALGSLRHAILLHAA